MEGIGFSEKMYQWTWFEYDW